MEAPLARHALESVAAFLFELNARAGDKVLDRRGHQHLVGRGAGADTGGDVYRHPTDVVVGQELNLAGVEPDPQPQAEGVHDLDNGSSAAECPRGAGKGGPETV